MPGKAGVKKCSPNELFAIVAALMEEAEICPNDDSRGRYRSDEICNHDDLVQLRVKPKLGYTDGTRDSVLSSRVGVMFREKFGRLASITVDRDAGRVAQLEFMLKHLAEGIATGLTSQSTEAAKQVLDMLEEGNGDG